MNIKEFLNKFSRNNLDRKVFSLLSTLIIIVGLFIVAGILFPTTVSVILNILWVVLVTFVTIFFVLGILVIVGMRSEVGQVLDAFLEGSLKIIDFLELVKNLWHQFVELVKDFLIFAAPYFAYVLSILLYILLLVIYKTVGRTQDVTSLTIILTFVSIFLFGFISKPRNDEDDTKWGKRFVAKLRAGFIDSFEVILFVFFLTMDSTNLFFLPSNLNVPISARVGSFDLMVRSISYKGHAITTLDLIVTTIIIEIVRNLLRIFAGARMYYLEYVHSPASEENKSVLIILKDSIRKSFWDSKNDLTKFITFNTVLFAAFLFLPRLKLLTLAVASATNLIMDIIIRARLTSRKGTDLISRTLAFVFRL